MSLIFVTFFVDAIAGSLELITIGGANVYAADVCYGILAAAAFARLGPLTNLKPAILLWIAFGAIVLFSWARGISAFSFASATNGMREFFYFWSGALYVASFAPGPAFLDRLYRVWTIVSLFLLLLVLSRFFFPIYALDRVLAAERDAGFDHIFLEAADYNALRMLTARATLVVAQCATMALAAYFWTGRTDWRARMAIVWIGFVVVMQHRTVWIVLLASVLLLLPSMRLRLSHVLAGVGITAGLAIALALKAVTGSTSILETSLAGAIAEATNPTDSTFIFRQQLWANYFDHWFSATLLEHVFGVPFGMTIHSWVVLGNNVVLTDVFPHNFYLYLVFFLGIAGTAVLLATYALAVTRLLAGGRQAGVSLPGRCLAILLIGQLVYSMSYAPVSEQSVLVGAALSLVAYWRGRERAPQLLLILPGRAPVSSP